MMREKYESLSLGVLKDLAKARDIKGTSTMKKAELVEASQRGGAGIVFSPGGVAGAGGDFVCLCPGRLDRRGRAAGL